MGIAKVTTHAALAKAKMLEQFKGLPNWEALLDGFSAQVQAVETSCLS